MAMRIRATDGRCQPQAGLRYNQFHTTALCSPSRSALLTGTITLFPPLPPHSILTAPSTAEGLCTPGSANLKS